MKIRVFLVLALFCALFLALSVGTPVYGQKPKDEIIVMKTFSVESRQYSKSYETIIANLDRLFSGPVKIYDPVPVDEAELAVSRHTIEDSPVRFFDFGFHGGELKALRGGFEIAGMGFYIKRGIAHRPEYNKHVTLTFGKRVTWGYNFRNQHDLFQETFRRPIERFNYVLENPVRTFFGFTFK